MQRPPLSVTEEQMAEKHWEIEQTCFCSHADMAVNLEVETVYPAESLPEQSPRLGAHRCSNAILCNQFNQGVCIWAGTNAEFDPFR
jgi:hypothetical protein